MIRAPHQVVQGSSEFLNVPVTSDRELTNQPVAISFDRETWWEATWLGDEGLTRTAQLLLDEDTTPEVRGWYAVLVRVTDNPEIPIINAGTLELI